MSTLYDGDGYVVVPGIRPQPIPLIIANCNGIELRCTHRDYWLNAWRVVDARPGARWPVGGKIKTLSSVAKIGRRTA